MPRDIPVGNGNFLINFDSDYQINDVYFPFVGQENHSKGSFPFGVWANGRCSWMGPEWETSLKYHDNSLVTDVFLKNYVLRLELKCSDAVDVDSNVFIRKIEIKNLLQKERKIKIFFGHNFHLYGNDIGDTAYFDPQTDSIIHYKANRYFLINCSTSKNSGVSHYGCGKKSELGAWKNVDKGELNMKPISWGSADSVIGIDITLPAGGKDNISYWIVAGTNYDEVAILNKNVIDKTPNELLKHTSNYWGAWVKYENRFFGDLPNSITNLFNRSLLILRTQIDNSGAIIAANDSDIIRFGKDTYSYMWGRDGAFITAALAKAGYPVVCRKFFDFCSRAISKEGYLYQHYNPDGSLASNWHPWVVDGKAVLPIQEDSTALIIWALWIYYEKSQDIEYIRPLYCDLINKSANFLVKHRDPETKLPLPSYDLWEERLGVHTFTVSAVYAGLSAAAKFARIFGDDSPASDYDKAANEIKEGLTKYFYDDGLKRYARSGYRTDEGYKLDKVIDISIMGLTTLGVLSSKDPRMIETTEAIKQQLWLKDKVQGCARYQNDMYQRASDSPPDLVGNPWFISTLWLGDYYVESAESIEELHKAIPYLQWCVDNALESGVFAEQVHPVDGSPLSVSPLTWSHSAFVWTILQYAEKFNKLNK